MVGLKQPLTLAREVDHSTFHVDVDQIASRTDGSYSVDVLVRLKKVAGTMAPLGRRLRQREVARDRIPASLIARVAQLDVELRGHGIVEDQPQVAAANRKLVSGYVLRTPSMRAAFTIACTFVMIADAAFASPFLVIASARIAPVKAYV